MNTKFSERIRELRIERGLSQAGLAKALNYTQSNICEWEQGRVEPRLSAILTISEFFGVDVDFLIGRTDELGAIAISGAPQLPEDERELLARYRSLRSDVKEAFWISLRAMSSSPADNITSKKKA